MRGRKSLPVQFIRPVTVNEARIARRGTATVEITSFKSKLAQQVTLERDREREVVNSGPVSCIPEEPKSAAASSNKQNEPDGRIQRTKRFQLYRTVG